ncbi:DUF4124 domain-containing protein [Halomonas eurihalina]|uniref:DUF4124 domain-containing protein n=1 Tax=Halomonas eurihalina TaxID=42566 RepID=A0A5D9D8X4_HALER|nr:DUF4124 domain-containing protein [Halomonas eurihalina]MDR5860243.1 DUF4124 domain-containing protein [Halomonas eurihalina]TZG40334.1 DUF4124 domain-containing protein [Halomonas eurihalina]
MDRPTITMLLCLVMVNQAMGGQALYRTIDARGHVSFSDDPSRGGEPVELAPISVVPALPASSTVTRAASSDADGDAPSRTYDVFTIAAPDDDTTLPTGFAGNVRVRLALRPALREGHKLRLLLDGEIVRPAAREPVIELVNLVRGEHRLRAELLDARGQVLRRTPAVTLHVQRASVNLPQNPHRPDSHGQADR